ncbi:3-oxoadipate enol-lactonase [Acinetobacter larvae]|uniref:3-oxoadipate enol-lactonase n=1 Tax=Acinetobacter larvae TaxID=1789224 RepID=A0A1B2LYQ9_9GAMM|nr:3-oxoadipate enol-lactonase [Acinetobacter larvae]AOA57913.1 3-oxoadipate enol-lactonase [Acinetobacter larvae]
MAHFRSDQAEIHYQVFGDPNKPALVFSNSLGTALSMWQAQIDFFQHNYYVICYDNRGHGQSSAPTGPYQLAQLGQDVIALLDHLGIQRAHFCGISMGGLIGQWLAIDAPTRFDRVIICNSAAKVGQTQAWLERATAVRRDGLAAIAATAASRWFRPAFIAQHPTSVQDLAAQLAAGSAEGYASCCEALAAADLRQQIQQITTPVLIIAGQYDPITTVADADAMQAAIPQSQRCILAASHISNIEQAQAFNHAVADFLKA